MPLNSIRSRQSSFTSRRVLFLNLPLPHRPHLTRYLETELPEISCQCVLVHFTALSSDRGGGLCFASFCWKFFLLFYYNKYVLEPHPRLDSCWSCLCHLYSLAPFSTATSSSSSVHVLMLQSVSPPPQSPVATFINSSPSVCRRLRVLLVGCLLGMMMVVMMLPAAAQNRTEEQNTKTLRISNQFQ